MTTTTVVVAKRNRLPDFLSGVAAPAPEGWWEGRFALFRNVWIRHPGLWLAYLWAYLRYGIDV